MSARLAAQLDGARYVKYDADAGQVLAWYGAHGPHSYSEDGTELDYWSIGDYSRDAATLEEVEDSIARRIRRVDEVLDQADEDGYQAGRAAGSWLTDGNTSPEAARALLRGIEDGDPLTLDLLSTSPLSGEWAGDPTPADVLAEYGLDETDDIASEVLDAWEDGWRRGVEDEATRSARGLLGLDATAA